MFGTLSDKFQGIFSSLLGKKRLSESNVSDAVREVRLALLEADVNYGVVKSFIKKVKEKALGEELLKSVEPGQQFVKMIHEELVALMGEEEVQLDFAPRADNASTSVFMLCGLQGAGKTTHCAKLAKYLQGKQFRKKVLLAACDLQRPAAIKQLQILGEQIGVPVFSLEGETDPLRVAQEALAHGKSENYDVLILDTAGRLHIDEALMEQLEQLKALLNPSELLFVANAAMGQDAVRTTLEFHERLGITGSILTMLDSGTRGGVAISIKEVTQCPLKFEGIGEKLDDFQLFNPRSMADRILGMGDTINLVKKAQEHMDEAEADKLKQKIKEASFSYSDYLKQMQAIRKMGPISKLLGMLPGVSALKDFQIPEKEFGKIEAMILSMTLDERDEKVELVVTRKKRIAKGSGVQLEEVNKMVKSFKRIKKMFKGMKNMKQLEKMMGGAPWH